MKNIFFLQGIKGDEVLLFDPLTYMPGKLADNRDPESRLNSKTKFHILGDDVSRDLDFFKCSLSMDSYSIWLLLT